MNTHGLLWRRFSQEQEQEATTTTTTTTTTCTYQEKKHLRALEKASRAENVNKDIQECVSTINQFTSASFDGVEPRLQESSRREQILSAQRKDKAYFTVINSLRDVSADSLALMQLAAHPDKLARCQPYFSPLPVGPFSILFIKPPWCKRGGLGEKGRLNIHDLAQLRPLQITASDAVMSMWSPLERIDDSIFLGKRWGFRYIGIQFICVRLVPESHTVWLGAPNRCWTRSNVEVVLLFCRGNPRSCVRNKTISQMIFCCENENGSESASWEETLSDAFTSSEFDYAMQKKVSSAVALFFEPRARTTFKPAQLLKTLERVYADLPRCVLFATKAHQSWAVWGDLVSRGSSTSSVSTPFNRTSTTTSSERSEKRSYAEYIARSCELRSFQQAMQHEEDLVQAQRKKKIQTMKKMKKMTTKEKNKNKKKNKKKKKTKKTKKERKEDEKREKNGNRSRSRSRSRERERE